jgi:hypothetical protein
MKPVQYRLVIPLARLFEQRIMTIDCFHNQHVYERNPHIHVGNWNWFVKVLMLRLKSETNPRKIQWESCQAEKLEWSNY